MEWFKIYITLQYIHNCTVHQGWQHVKNYMYPAISIGKCVFLPSPFFSYIPWFALDISPAICCHIWPLLTSRITLTHIWKFLNYCQHQKSIIKWRNGINELLTLLTYKEISFKIWMSYLWHIISVTGVRQQMWSHNVIMAGGPTTGLN
jgi:hypothetical protein